MTAAVGQRIAFLGFFVWFLAVSAIFVAVSAEAPGYLDSETALALDRDEISRAIRHDLDRFDAVFR